jgi:hypothetical protein
VARVGRRDFRVMFARWCDPDIGQRNGQGRT